MQILSKTIKLTGTEKEDVLIGVNVSGSVVLVLDNRGPGTVEIKDVGALQPNRFLVIGGMGEIKLHPPTQIASVDVSVFLK